MPNTKKITNNLNEVSFIRPILIILLVLYHAFAPFCESWRPFDGYEENKFYWWIGKLSYSFMLPTFVFISGYVWAYQRENLCRLESFISLIKKKIKRLYLPSLIFGVLYIPLMPKWHDNSSIFIARKIIEGNAHMWFLPMLLSCFILAWFILKIKSKTKRWLIVLISMMCSFIHFPFQLDATCYYLLYFIIGYTVECNKNYIINKITISGCILSWCLFFLTFIIISCLKNNMIILDDRTISFINKAFLLLTNRTTTILCSLLGLASLYQSAILYTRNHILSNTFITVGEYCFGIYIFQQFILQSLYYHTILPRIMGCNMLPWIGFFCALIGSYIISFLLKKSIIGRKLV